MLLKFIITMFLLLDLGIGINFLLNALHIFDNSKYSQGATILYSIIFIVLSVLGIYYLFFISNHRIALWISIGPWLLVFIILFLSMIFSNPR